MTVHSPVSTADALREIKEILGDRILLDEEVRSLYRSDFGRMADRLPGAVARCSSAEEVAEVVRLCRERRIPLVPRGQAHTQSGQATTDGGILLDTTVMNTIHEIDEAGETATVDCGVVWRDLVTATLEKGMVPRVLTNNLGVQISGTVSMAGLGVASFRYGAQADNVDELQVVTGTGEIVTCSRDRNRDLFDVVRSGLGQFGVITRAKVRLRKCKSVVRKYYLLYDDLGVFMEDAKKVMDPGNPTFSSLESWCTPASRASRRSARAWSWGRGCRPSPSGSTRRT
ncbi:MAG: FAD-binding protein [Thermoanaerobaculia bacterium]